MTKYDKILRGQARDWATFGTCQRLAVGAVLARDGRPVSSGYNGAPTGLPHCQHQPGDVSHCEDATHAEENVVAYAARHGVATLGTTLYITHSPCYRCSGLIIAAGVIRVVFDDLYGSTKGLEKLREAGVNIEH